MEELRCPDCDIVLKEMDNREFDGLGRNKREWFVCDKCGKRYKLIGGG